VIAPDEIHLYPDVHNLPEWLEAVCANVEKFPRVDHWIPFPGEEGLMHITPANRDQWLKDTRELIAQLRLG
jgi:hypothetical protein